MIPCPLATWIQGTHPSKGDHKPCEETEFPCVFNGKNKKTQETCVFSYIEVPDSKLVFDWDLDKW